MTLLELTLVAAWVLIVTYYCSAGASQKPWKKATMILTFAIATALAIMTF